MSLRRHRRCVPKYSVKASQDSKQVARALSRSPFEHKAEAYHSQQNDHIGQRYWVSKTRNTEGGKLSKLVLTIIKYLLREGDSRKVNIMSVPSTDFGSSSYQRAPPLAHRSARATLVVRIVSLFASQVMSADGTDITLYRVAAVYSAVFVSHSRRPAASALKFEVYLDPQGPGPVGR